MQLRGPRSKFRPQRTDHRSFQRLNQGDVQAASACRRGHLRADEACANHHDPAAGFGGNFELTPDPQRISLIAKRVHALKRIRAGQTDRIRAGGDDQAVERDLLAVVEGDEPTPGVEPYSATSASEIKTQFRDLVRASQQDALGIPLAGQELLRQRRTIVGFMRLIADQDDLSAS